MKPGLSLVPSSADPAVKRWKRIAAGATAANQDPAAYKAWWAKVVAHDSNRWAAAHHVAFQQAGHQLSPESLHRPTTGPPRVVDPEIRRIHTEGVVAAWDHPDTHRLAAERAAGRAKVEAESAENAAWEAQGVDADAREPSALRGKQVWLYHGTSDLFLSDIQTNGLRPGQVSEPSNFGTASRGNRRQSKVFLTDDPTAARNYARNAAQRQGGSPVVLRMLVAGNDLSRDRDDREIAGIGAHQYTAPEVAADRVMEVNDRRIRPLAKGITMIGFFEFSRLTKAQQLALFGGQRPPTALPLQPATKHATKWITVPAFQRSGHTVPAHLRRVVEGQHHYEPVGGHPRQVEPEPVPEPEPHLSGLAQDDRTEWWYAPARRLPDQDAAPTWRPADSETLEGGIVHMRRPLHHRDAELLGLVAVDRQDDGTFAHRRFDGRETGTTLDSAGESVRVGEAAAPELFAVLDSRRGEFLRRVDAIQKRAAKLGLEAQVVTEAGKLFRTVPVELIGWGDHARVRTERRGATLYHITGPALVVKGWTAEAVIKPVPGTDKTTISRIGRATDLPIRLRTTGMHCDHCGANRERGFVIALRNNTSGNWQQVGGTCLADFTGRTSAQLATNAEALANWWKDKDGDLDSYGEDLPHRPTHHDLHNVLMATIAVINERGRFVSAKEAKDTLERSTADDVSDLLRDPDAAGKVLSNPEYNARAQAIAEWMRAIPLGGDGNEYLGNLHAVGHASLVGPGQLGMAVSAANAYARAMGEKATTGTGGRGRDAAPVTPLGKAGDMIGGKTSAADRRAGIERHPPRLVKVIGRQVRDGFRDGDLKVTLHLRDADGHVFVWESNANSDAGGWERDHLEAEFQRGHHNRIVEMGETFRLTSGTIAGFGTWKNKDGPETRITRAKMQRVYTPSERKLWAETAGSAVESWMDEIGAKRGVVQKWSNEATERRMKAEADNAAHRAAGGGFRPAVTTESVWETFKADHAADLAAAGWSARDYPPQPYEAPTIPDAATQEHYAATTAHAAVKANATATVHLPVESERPLVKGTTMMIGFFEFSRLTKAQQLALFGGQRPPTALPMATGPHHDVQVKAHLRATSHGMQMVTAHTRSVLTASDAFRLGRKDLQKHVEAGGENAATAQAELDRRQRKREETPAIARAEEAAATATPAEVAAAPTPEPAVVPVPVEPMPEPGGNPEPERIPGGESSGMSTQDFDAGALARGTAEESEHTTDPDIAQEIAMDHLAEDPGAYPAAVPELAAEPTLEERRAAHRAKHGVLTTEAVVAELKAAGLQSAINTVRRKRSGYSVTQYGKEVAISWQDHEGIGNGPEQFERVKEAIGEEFERTYTNDRGLALRVGVKKEPAPVVVEPEVAQDLRGTDDPPVRFEGDEEVPDAAAEVEDAPAAYEEGEAEPVDTERRGTGDHHDVGEVLWGARKHKWKKGDRVTAENLASIEELGSLDAAKAVTKAAVFGKYDHQRDRDAGDTAGASYLKARIIDTVAPAANPLPGDRKWYVEGAEWLHRELDHLHTAAEVKTFLANWKLGIEGHMVEDRVYSVAELRDLGIATKHDPDEGAWGTGGQAWFMDDPHDFKVIQKTYGKGAEARTFESKKHQAYMVTATALRAGGFSEAVAPVLGPDGYTTGYRLAKPAGKGENNMFTRYGFALAGLGVASGTGAEFRKTMKKSKLLRAIVGTGSVHDTHIPQARTFERAGDESWDNPALGKVAINASAKAERNRGTRWSRALTPITRTGGTPLPAIVDGDTLRDTFGFRGVQHGNWVDQESRAIHMKHAHGALLDLADIMGIEPKAIAHGQRLGLAFGARGGGAAGAHYEPNDANINLTHTQGAGTLAHEWGHFMDHQQTADTKAVVRATATPRSTYMSHGDEGAAFVHPEVADAWREVTHAMTSGAAAEEPEEARLTATVRDLERRWASDRDYIERGRIQKQFHEAYRELSKKYPDRVNVKRKRGESAVHPKFTRFAQDAVTLGAAYWASPREMFARAFESYVEDELKARGRSNTYLVAGTAIKYEMARVGKTVEPYPHGEERTKIHDSIRNLVAVMSRHQTMQKAMERMTLIKAALLHLEAPRERPEEPMYPFAGFIEYQGVPIDVETAAGTFREGVDPDGKAWKVRMPAHYGEVRGTVAADGDAVDVFVGPEAFAPFVYVVQTCDPTTKKFDEPKCMLGYLTKAEALRTFRASYNRRGMVLSVTTWPIGAWVAALARPKVAAGKMDRPLRKADLERTIHLDVSAGAA